ncbi:MAG: methionine synthase, partial [Chloroflexota bacterium]
IYDQVLQDAVGKHLRLKAAWQERALRRLAAQTIILLDEPYMASFGSTFIALSRQQVMDLIEEVLAGLHGLKGVHCCGNTDWSLVLSTSVDIISVDAYDYAATLVPHAEAIQRFLQRGGIIAWGIVPAGAAAQSETAASLVERLEAAMDRLAAAGVSREALRAAGLVAPSCSLAALDVPLAESILDLVRAVSVEMRRRYIKPAHDGREPALGR